MSDLLGPEKRRTLPSGFQVSEYATNRDFAVLVVESEGAC